MLNILHISDLHFGPPFVPNVGEALLQSAEQLAPDVIVASGDLTQRARPWQFAEARAFLDRLPPVPLVVVPGNHDVPLDRLTRLYAPYRDYVEHISPHLDQVHEVNHAVIVGLNSTAPYRAVKNGRIRSWQLGFCSQVFQDLPPGALRVVVAHHHFAPAPDYERVDDVMPKARRAIDHFIRLRVDLILGGHLHRGYIGNTLDLYPGNREHGIIIVQCGTTTSRRGRAREQEKNSFNLIQAGESTIVVTHFMYFHETGGFVPASRHTFPRPGRGYLSIERDVHAIHGE